MRAHPGRRAFSAISFFLLATMLAPGSSACGGGTQCEPPDGGFPGVCGSYPCPLAAEGDAIDGDTYATFAAPLFETYCLRCHSTSRTQNCVSETNPACRNGAPVDHNWDDPASIRRFLGDMRHAIGIQPYFMPPEPPDPTCEERYRLVRWIDAGAPGLP